MTKVKVDTMKLAEKTMGCSLDKISTSSTGNIKIKQHLCVRHSLPRTRLKNTILYDNVNEDRHLQKALSILRSRRERTSLYLDMNRKYFEREQAKKQEKWKKEDWETLYSWNLPSLNPLPESQHIPYATTMYTAPTYVTEKATRVKQPVLPMLKVKRERTEIVTKDDRSYIAKLPPVVEVDQEKLSRYNTYTGKNLNKMWAKDQRFLGLSSNLQPALLKKWDQYPTENLISKSRVSKFLDLVPLKTSTRKSAKKCAKVVVVSRPPSHSSGYKCSSIA